MKQITILCAFITLTGCTQVVTKDNAASFDTWKLCTLLYRPHEMYDDWIVEEDENKVMEEELQRRGVNAHQCSVAELAKAKCVEYGFEAQTDAYAQCRQREEQYINTMTESIRAGRAAKQAAESAAFQRTLNQMQLQRIESQQQQQILNQQLYNYQTPWYLQ